MTFMIVADRHKEMTIMDTAIDNCTEVAISNRVGILLHKDSANMTSARDNDTEVAIKTQRDRYIQIVWIVSIASCVHHSHEEANMGSSINMRTEVANMRTVRNIHESFEMRMMQVRCTFSVSALSAVRVKGNKS